MSIYHKQVSIKDIASGFKTGVTNTASFFYHFSPSTVVNELIGLFSKLKLNPKPKKDIKAQLSIIFQDISNQDLNNMTATEMQTLLIGIIPIPTVETITIDSTTGEILEPDQSSISEKTKEQVEAQE